MRQYLDRYITKIFIIHSSKATTFSVVILLSKSSNTTTICKIRVLYFCIYNHLTIMLELIGILETI